MTPEHEVEIAAGGLLWRDSERREKLAVVHRTRHEDWSLPKGKFDPERDETWVDTAAREVREETNCTFDVGEFADCISYSVEGKPKVVFFWNMFLLAESEVAPDGETDELRWMSVSEALELIEYPEQRTVLARAVGRTLPVDRQPRTVQGHLWRQLVSWSAWPRGGSHGRLSSLLRPYQTELSHEIGVVSRERGDEDAGTPPWAAAACSLLEEATVALEENDTDRAWRCFHAATRLELFGLHELDRDSFEARATTIAREADDKLDSWRKRAVEDLIGMRGDLKDDVTVAEVYEAATILHGHFDNQYFKIRMLKRQSSTLAAIALATTIALLAVNGLAVSIFSPEVDMTGDHSFTIAVALFGVLGASVSGFLALAKAGARRKIPDQIVSSWVTFARPMVGAAAALLLFGLLISGLFPLGETVNPGLVLVVAFAAGSSERLLDRAIQSVET